VIPALFGRRRHRAGARGSPARIQHVAAAARPATFILRRSKKGVDGLAFRCIIAPLCYLLIEFRFCRDSHRQAAAL